MSLLLLLSAMLSALTGVAGVRAQQQVAAAVEAPAVAQVASPARSVGLRPAAALPARAAVVTGLAGVSLWKIAAVEAAWTWRRRE